jgi:hypothetical protein
LLKLFGGNNVDDSTTLTGSELNSSINQGEQRVVATTANIFSGVESGATLTNENGSGGD